MRNTDHRWIRADIPKEIHRALREQAFAEGVTLPKIVEVGLTAYIKMLERKAATAVERKARELLEKGNAYGQKANRKGKRASRY